MLNTGISVIIFTMMVGVVIWAIRECTRICREIKKTREDTEKLRKANQLMSAGGAGTRKKRMR